MQPIYLPLILSLAAPVTPGPQAPATPVWTRAPAESPTSTATTAPLPATAEPSAEPSASPRPSPETSQTPAPSATTAAGGSATPPAAMEFSPIGARASSEIVDGLARWTMWVEYQNPSPARDVVGVALVGSVRV